METADHGADRFAREPCAYRIDHVEHALGAHAVKTAMPSGSSIAMAISCARSSRTVFPPRSEPRVWLNLTHG